jgi:hypothetical protein
MMKGKTLLVGAAALIIGGAALTPQLVSAYRGDPNVQGPNCSPERHEAMTQAFESHDYQAWAAQMQGKGRVAEVVNEENFDRFAEAHRLALEGKTEEAAQIRAELGLGVRGGPSSEKGQGQGQGRGRMSSN